MTQEDFKARVSMAYEGREQWDVFLDRVWAIHTSELPRWISVEDELPENYREVIIAISHHFCYTAFRCGDKWYLNDNLNTRELPSATHWMPMPKMPVLSNLENTGKDEKGGEV